MNFRNTVYLIIVVLIIALLVLPAFFVTEENAIDAMRAAGYSDINVTAKSVILVSLLGCGRGDSVMFDVIATNPLGERVTNAYVCVGWPLKGATIRYR